MGRILTVEQAAEKLQVAPKTVRAWLRAGRIPAAKIGRTYRISEDGIEDMVRGRETKSATGDNRRRWLQLSQEEREQRVRAAMGMFAGSKFTVDDFLREKHAEVEEEERRWEERLKARDPRREEDAA